MGPQAFQSLAACKFHCRQLLAVFLIAWLGCGAAYAESGDAAPDKSAQQLVSLAPSLTEIVFALGAGKQLVGVTRYCDYPKEATTLPKVGGFADPHIEAIVALQPGLVLVLRDQQSIQQRLSRLGVEVLVLRHHTLEDIYQSIKTIGARLDLAATANALVLSMKERVAQITAAIPQQKRPRVLISVGGHAGPTKLETVYAAGNPTFYGELVRLAGGANAYTGNIEYGKLSAEAVLTLNPDVILELLPNSANPVTVTEEGVTVTGDKRVTVTEERLAAWREFPRLKAVQQQRVHVLTDEFIVNPGPRVVQTLELFAKAIHPSSYKTAEQNRASR